MNTALAERPQAPALDAKVIEQVLLGGDLSKLTTEQRLSYYNRVCESLGLNPMTQPFAYLRLSGKEVLYAKKDATEQLRKVHGVSITEVSSQQIGDVFVVTAKAMDAKGRTDASTGAVTIGNLKGDALANALMKAETKAKRRVTLSICGLGMLDETELETVRQDPPVVKVENVPALAEPPIGAVYIVQVEPKRKNGYEWADVTLSTGEVVQATDGMQMVALCEQILQEHAPAVIDTEKAKKKNGAEFTKIVSVARWKPAQPPEAPAEPEIL